MMVETILESPTDLGMSDGAGGLPQWKKEVLLRRAARGQPAARACPAPPAVPLAPPPDDEELRYGPGIVKRLQSRYLSLALRDQPRRRPSVLRRAASLDLLPAETTARAPAPAPRPDPPAAPRLLPRDVMKRARSVDVLGRPETYVAPPPGPPAWCRPPRRPAPLLRPSERPPPDAVRAALRKFECRPRRAGPEPRAPPAEPPALEPDADLPRPPRHPSATNTVLLARHSSPRRVGIIRPMPAVPREESSSKPLVTVETPIEPPTTAEATEKLSEFVDKPTKLSVSAADTPRNLFESAEGPRKTFDPADVPRILYAPAEPTKKPSVGVEVPRNMSVATQALRKPFVTAEEAPSNQSVAVEPLKKPSVVADALRNASAATEAPRKLLLVAAEALKKPSVAEEAPSNPSVAVELLRKPSVVTEPLKKAEIPRNLYVAAEVLKKPSVAEEAPSNPSVAVELLRKPSVAAEPLKKAEIPRNSSVAAEVLKKPSVAEEAPSNPSVAVELLRKPFVAAEPLKKAEIPRNSSVAAEALRKPSVAAEALRNASAATEAPRKPPVAAEHLRKPSVAAEVPRYPVASEALRNPSVATEGPSEPTVAAEVLKKSPVAAESPKEALRKSPGLLGVRLRGASPAGGTSVVFNFCSRPDVPDYIENDGVRGARADPESEEERDGAASPCAVRFVNDNVLINGRSSLSGPAQAPARPRDRHPLKLQFDDSLTVTFEYPSESSLLEDEDEGEREATPPDTPAAHHALPNNAVLGASSLSSYQPCKSYATSFQLGLTRPLSGPPPAPAPGPVTLHAAQGACGEAHSFSRSRDLRTDLLF